MPSRRRAYLNDNIRTEHLKCSNCRTQSFLVKIEPDGSGGEVRTFVCPHCEARRLLRLTPPKRALGALFVAEEVRC
jgi:DNA-directed RNA polymerase subunit RPC12/RpoP